MGGKNACVVTANADLTGCRRYRAFCLWLERTEVLGLVAIYVDDAWLML